ncbi:hypothetical protein NX862_03110 [Rhodobacter sp. KR11]|uniref:glycosyltransferase n=1 Tax=Rhodobacter sp. KR11 TaxID=2974588 RepID=UPI0022222B74|nr:glycosyltransferase [Rhodobacter sp. KR11]MCW1917730.1 hypothetical protein [Rhodobacter sp. KR11]
MAMRVLLAWELGGNWGHARRLEAVARALQRRGHEVHLAVQDLGPFLNMSHLTQTHPDQANDQPGARLWQAPLWGGLLRFSPIRPLGPPRRFGDLLANLGLQDPAALEPLLRAWETLFHAIRPDVLVADFAPSALLAARGRLPRIAIGTGFTVPPTHLAEFPPFPGAEPDPQTAGPLIAEPLLLAKVNATLARIGRPTLDRLPQITEAEALMPAVFAELDPYRGLRSMPHLSPFLAGPLPSRPATREGIFAYLPGRSLTEAGFATLLALGPSVLAVMPDLDAPRRAALVAAGVRLSDKTLGWGQIATHAAVLCNGGMGTVSQSLAMGLPLAVLPGGVEQDLTARALAAWGLSIDLVTLADPLALLRAGQRAEALASDFRTRLSDPALAVAEQAETLAKGTTCEMVHKPETS